jgi:hypothetical protein
LDVDPRYSARIEVIGMHDVVFQAKISGVWNGTCELVVVTIERVSVFRNLRRNRSRERIVGHIKDIKPRREMDGLCIDLIREMVVGNVQMD